MAPKTLTKIKQASLAINDYNPTPATHPQRQVVDAAL